MQNQTIIKRFFLVFLIGLFLALSVSICSAGLLYSKLETNHFKINYKNIPDEQAKEFSEKAEKAFSDVTQYLGKKYKKKIKIYINNKYKIPRTTKDKKILMPANRIRGDAGGPPSIKGRGPAIIHEVTHIIAKSAYFPDRFLDEGLAVYIQAKFEAEGERNYPNMGKEIHKEALKCMNEYGKIIPLKECEKTRRSKKSGLARRTAYVQEGSFAKYLIEKYTLQKFMEVYEGKTYSKIYGKSFEDLEKEWAGFIKQK